MKDLIEVYGWWLDALMDEAKRQGIVFNIFSLWNEKTDNDNQDCFVFEFASDFNVPQLKFVLPLSPSNLMSVDEFKEKAATEFNTYIQVDLDDFPHGNLWKQTSSAETISAVDRFIVSVKNMIQQAASLLEEV